MCTLKNAFQMFNQRQASWDLGAEISSFQTENVKKCSVSCTVGPDEEKTYF